MVSVCGENVKLLIVTVAFCGVVVVVDVGEVVVCVVVVVVEPEPQETANKLESKSTMSIMKNPFFILFHPD